MRASPLEEKQQAESVAGDLHTSHLRSSREVMGYAIHGTDGKAGTLEDLLIDPEEGRIRYMVVKTGEWLSHRHVLISPDRITKVNWSESKIETRLPRHDIEACPEYGSLVS
jgi:sporulation protein YlmC with PRC-barrel domain